MIHHPEVAKKAQGEIERVLGKDQLPTLADRPDLPYIDCIVKEVMRSVNETTQLLFTNGLSNLESIPLLR